MKSEGFHPITERSEVMHPGIPIGQSPMERKIVKLRLKKKRKRV
jgi:hypothetical protein